MLRIRSPRTEEVSKLSNSTKAPEIFAESGQSIDEEAQAQIVDLERMVGKLALENEILKKAKSLLSARPAIKGRL